MNINSSSESVLQQHVLQVLERCGWDLSSDVELEVKLTGLQMSAVADIVLNVQSVLPIAVIEITNKTLSEGLTQARRYAEQLDVPFAFSTNGKQVLCYDKSNDSQIEDLFSLAEFPDKNELWQKYAQRQQQELVAQVHDKGHNSQPPAYQQTAIDKVTAAISQEEKRILLVMAQGTGKHHVVFQALQHLLNTGQVKRALFLSDRSIIIDQNIVNRYKVFGETATKIANRQIKPGYSVYFGLYQALTGSGKNQKTFKQVESDFFDLIIVDECHRSIKSKWQEILDYYSSAIQLGITSTPRASLKYSIIGYFGSPVFTYGFEQSIQEGYSAAVKLIQFNIEPTLNKNFELNNWSNILAAEALEMDNRIQKVARSITEYLRSHDPMVKTIIFCSSSSHAEFMRRSLAKLNPEQLEKNSRYVVHMSSDAIRNTSILEDFVDPESPYPVIATTVDLLTDGVDIPTCKLLVIDREIKSHTRLVQMIARGTRIAKQYDKSEFTILDFTDTTARFSSALEGIVQESIQIDSINQLQSPTPKPTPKPTTINEKQPLNEARLVLVGDVGVGKTTLVSCLTESSLLIEEVTKGVNYTHCTNLSLDTNVDLTICDFAGQYFAFSNNPLYRPKNNLYLLVLDAQKEESQNRIYYWLNFIRTNAGKQAAIIIAITKIDQGTFNPFNLERFSNEFNIVDVLYTSAARVMTGDSRFPYKNDDSIAILKNSITREVSKLTSVKKLVSSSWLHVKKQFENLQHYHVIELRDFERLCVQNGIVDNIEQQELLEMLANWGIIYRYQDKTTQIIYLAWLIESLHHIVCSPVISDDGRLKVAIIGEKILSRDNVDLLQEQYEYSNYRLLVTLLCEFKMAFMIDADTILIPSKLTPISPAFDLISYQQGLNYRFQYDQYFAKYVIWQLTVELAAYTDPDSPRYWQQGVFLNLGSCKAVVFADEDSNTIDIAINYENNSAAKALFEMIRQTIREINGPDALVEELLALTTNENEDAPSQTTKRAAINPTQPVEDKEDSHLPQRLLSDFQQWEYQLLLKIHDRMVEKSTLKIQQQLPQLKRELTAIKVELVAIKDRFYGVSPATGATELSNFRITYKYLNDLIYGNSLCNQLAQEFAPEIVDWQRFISPFNQMIKHYALSQSLLIDEI